MKLMKIFTLCFLLTIPASAYVPRANTIIEKMVLNNGSGEYKIAREVTLTSAQKEFKIRELWTIAYGDKMRLEVSSLDSLNPWSFVILFSESKRSTLSSLKSPKTFNKSREFIEPLHHDRSSRSLTHRLIRLGFVPDWLPNAPAPTVQDNKTVMTPEPFVRLEPVGGSVSYAIGTTSSGLGGQNQPQLWIEQDSFLISKMRLGSKAEFTNSDYQSFPGGLKLPGEQIIVWDNSTAKIKLLSVERTKTSPQNWSLNGVRSELLPSDPLIKEFYSRFR